MKGIILNALIILAASAAIVLLLKKGGDAGVSKIKEVTAPANKVAGAPIRPPAIDGQVDNFNGTLTLEPLQSWGAKAKYGFLLATCGDSKLNQPHARVTFAYPTAAATVLEIQYTVPQNVFEMMAANAEAINDSSSMAVQVTAEGSDNTSCALLELDPLRRPEDRKWLSRNLIVPLGTKAVQFRIAGLPPRYNVSRFSCAIFLPQLRVIPGKATATPGGKPTATTATP